MVVEEGIVMFFYEREKEKWLWRTFSADQLRRVGMEILEGANVPGDEARLTVEILVESNLCGQDSHGIMLLPGYVRNILEEKTRPGSKIRVVKDTPTMSLIDGGWGLGQVVATKAMDTAIEKAEKVGIGVVGTFNCSHIGRIGHYPMQAVARDMIGFTTVNASPLVSPWGGIKRLIGTNPIAFGIPTGEEKPFLLDMATSVSAVGKVNFASHAGIQMPPGYMLDKDGKPTTDPEKYFQGGSLIPLGDPVGYKGYGLGLVVEALGGILTTAGACSNPEEYKGGNGTMMMAINISFFQPVEDFKRRTDDMIRAMKSSPPRPGFTEILAPGEYEWRYMEKRSKEGVPMPLRTWQELRKAGRSVKIDIDQVID